jgi:GntR family transcriptional regulator
MKAKGLTAPASRSNSATRLGVESTSSEKPLYLRIVETLQREIINGLYPVGTPLPSESMLVGRFAVSRHTVREALRTMRQSGLVASRQGLGTIVRRPGESAGYVHHINTISDLFPVEVETRYEPVDGTLVALPDAGNLLPELPEGRQWLRIRALRNRLGHSAPFNELEAFVASRFAGVGRAIRVQSGPIYGMIEALYGESIGAVEQIFGAFECDGQIGQPLGMQKGDIGIEVRRIFRLAQDGDVAMVSFNRYLPATFSFSMTLRKMRS